MQASPQALAIASGQSLALGEKKNASLVSNKFLGYGFAYGAVPQKQSLKKAQPGQILVVFSSQQSKDTVSLIS